MTAGGSGWSWLVDLVIAMTVLEAAALAIHHRLTGRGVAPRDFLPNLVSGLALMLALRAAIGGTAGGWLPAALLLAGLAHAVDLRRRWTGWR